MLFAYPVDLEPDEDGRIVARCPDVKGCVSDGADTSEALIEIADALGTALVATFLAGEDIPPPSPAKGRPVVSAGAVVSAKIALRIAMREAGVSNVDLGRRLGVNESEVRRMIDFKHQTKIGRLEEALIILGQRVTLLVEAA